MTWNLLKESEKKYEDFWKSPEYIVKKSGIKVLVWGPPETGKTHFALTAPEPIHVIDTEFGTYPLLCKEPFKNKDIRVFEAAQLNVESAEIDPVKSIEAVEEAISFLKDINEGTVVIDSVTDIWQWLGAWLEVTASVRTASGRPYQFES